MYDLCFFFNNTGRYISILRSSQRVYSWAEILKVTEFIGYFNMISERRRHPVVILNYYYFFRYYFGVMPFYMPYKHEYAGKVHYFNYGFICIGLKERLFSFLYIFLTDLYYAMKPKKVFLAYYNNFLYMRVQDKNFLMNIRNTLGFFNLDRAFHVQLRFYNPLETSIKALSSLLKIRKV